MNAESEQLSPEAQPFTSFLTLEGAVKGQIKEGIKQVKCYLKDFGYYEDEGEGGAVVMDDSFDEKLESALKSYQRFFRLEPIGKLDANTVKQMSIPRCGVPDCGHLRHAKKNASKSHMVAEYSLFTGKPKWPPTQTRRTFRFDETSLGTFRFDETSLGNAVSLEELRGLFMRVFQRWADDSPFTFEEALSTEMANIVIGFYRGDHGDGYPFSGTTLAHVFLPIDGRFHYNLKWQWSTNSSLTQADLESVAVHEIGYLLGLDHSKVRKAIMYPLYKPGAINKDLQQDNVK